MQSKRVHGTSAKIWLVTGASRGIGLQIVLAALSSGDFVTAGARDPEALRLMAGESERLLAVPLDVTKPDEVSAAVQKSLDHFGSLDVLVNNAGYGLLGAFEELSPSSLEAQFATNLFGAFNVTKAVLPVMRKQRSGHIISISSISGISGCAMASAYCASKYALAGWSDSLSKELALFGIAVSTVYPGTFKTDFFNECSSQSADGFIEDYRVANEQWAAMRADPRNEPIGDPAALGHLIVLLAASKTPPTHLAAGSDAIALFQKQATIMQDISQTWRSLSLATDVSGQV